MNIFKYKIPILKEQIWLSISINLLYKKKMEFHAFIAEKNTRHSQQTFVAVSFLIKVPVLKLRAHLNKILLNYQCQSNTSKINIYSNKSDIWYIGEVFTWQILQLSHSYLTKSLRIKKNISNKSFCHTTIIIQKDYIFLP